MFVEVGINHTRYIKFSKGTKFMYLSKACWDKLSENQKNIDDSLLRGKCFRLDFENTKKRVQTDTYRGNWMVTLAEEFEKDGEEFTKFLSFSTIEWATLKQQLRQVNRVMNDWHDAYVLLNGKLSLLSPVVLQVEAHGEATVAPPAGSDQGVDEGDGAAPPPPTKPRRRLVPPMCRDTFISFLYRFLLLKAIATAKKLTCKGCRQNKGSTHPLHSGDVNSCQVSDSIETSKVLTEAARERLRPLKEAMQVIRMFTGWHAPQSTATKSSGEATEPNTTVNKGNNESQTQSQDGFEEVNDDDNDADCNIINSEDDDVEYYESNCTDEDAVRLVTFDFKLDCTERFCCPMCERLYNMYTEMFEAAFRETLIFKEPML